ncbi:MAG: hypothetical protein ABT20_15100 [Rubrivivax sp. SCN 70-15]|nr:MAG: hypothetical protein ABT20_15100 [Rubrivivax sp. SCN 70-15]
MKRTLCAVGLCWALAASAAAAQPEAATTAEPALRDAVEQAVWPGDIVQAADRYLSAYPTGAGAAAVQSLRDRAAGSWRLLRSSEVRLYRSAFAAQDPALEQDLREAALGDRAAAVRLAQASRAYDEAHGTQRYVGWLQFAALLGDERASYALALHFRRTGQPVLAAHYEALALALGYQPAVALDNVRK